MLRSRVGAVHFLPASWITRLMRLTGAFEEFLLNYKSTQTDLDAAATDAFQDLNIDGDGTSDEYDFMDDVAGGKEARRPLGQPPEARRKYMDMLQRVADRQLDQVTIELDDLDNVSLLRSSWLCNTDGVKLSTKRALARIWVYDWLTRLNGIRSITSTSFRKPWTR